MSNFDADAYKKFPFLKKNRNTILPAGYKPLKERRFRAVQWSMSGVLHRFVNEQKAVSYKIAELKNWPIEKCKWV